MNLLFIFLLFLFSRGRSWGCLFGCLGFSPRLNDFGVEVTQGSIPKVEIGVIAGQRTVYMKMNKANNKKRFFIFSNFSRIRKLLNLLGWEGD
jgi:hypothetical protein